MKFLNGHRAGHVYSKGHLRNILYIPPLNFAVSSRNKKGEEYGDFGHIRISTKILKLPTNVCFGFKNPWKTKQIVWIYRRDFQ